MKIIYLFFFLLYLFGCQQEQRASSETNETIVLCFDHYDPKPYKTPGIGMAHIPMPKVLYTDSTGALIDYAPKATLDTITLYSPCEFKEVALSYRNFEFIYYMLMQGDTITISMDSLDYPILKSKHNAVYDRIYNMNYELRKGRTHCGLEAKTCLGSDFATIAQDIDYILTQEWGAKCLKDYCSIDSLNAMFDDYKKAYIDTITYFKQQSAISDKMYEHYKFLLQLKEYESQLILNKDSLFYQQMEHGISDKYYLYPSYYEYLDYYLWYYNRNIKLIRQSQGATKDWIQTFNELSVKDFEPKSKHILLLRCIKEISENFSARELNLYLDKYLEITKDTFSYNEIREQYNLSADANQLLLKDMTGKSTTLQEVLNENRGKVIYVDFWASWCVPCREEMAPSAKLRGLYTKKDVVFLYLSYNDTENNWRKAAEQEGLSGISTSYFITNSKNSKILEKIKLDLIPRYIIFDKKGNMVEMNAPRPSNSQITKTIDKYLKE